MCPSRCQWHKLGVCVGHKDNTQISRTKKICMKCSPNNSETELQCGWNTVNEKSVIDVMVIYIDHHVLKRNKRHVLGAMHLK